MKKVLLFISVMFTLLSCNSQDCIKLPQAYSSYNQAVKAVKNSTFVFTDEANTSGSSWISSASFYSCDGKSGYLIYTTNSGREYIHQGVPIDIWRAFKKASSKGSFYNSNIKNRFRLRLSN